MGPGASNHVRIPERFLPGAHEARFLRPAYYALMRHAESAPGVGAVLAVGRSRVPIAARAR